MFCPNSGNYCSPVVHPFLSRLLRHRAPSFSPCAYLRGVEPLHGRHDGSSVTKVLYSLRDINQNRSPRVRLLLLFSQRLFLSLCVATTCWCPCYFSTSVIASVSKNYARRSANLFTPMTFFQCHVSALLHGGLWRCVRGMYQHHPSHQQCPFSHFPPFLWMVIIFRFPFIIYWFVAGKSPGFTFL